jgi:sugar O-acyltransferase (sialic acid O-acetyltransferase NeuD family)
MSKILIVGAKGFAKELIETVLQNDPECEVTFYDDLSDDLPSRLFGRYPIIRNMEAVEDYFGTVDRGFALGVGSPSLRAQFYDSFVKIGGEPRTVISPFAKIGSNGNRIGDAVCVLADAIIESDNVIGRGSLIHVGAFVSHDVTVGSFCEISPRANLLGGVSIGEKCRIGTNSTILPRISVGDDAVVGAGAVVTKCVRSGELVAGVPARPLEE